MVLCGYGSDMGKPFHTRAGTGSASEIPTASIIGKEECLIQDEILGNPDKEFTFVIDAEDRYAKTTADRFRGCLKNCIKLGFNPINIAALFTINVPLLFNIHNSES